MGGREEDISVFWSDKDTFNTVDPCIALHSKVAREDRMRGTCGDDLKDCNKNKEEERMTGQ
jgi:hypothetical protein